jgi:hypothetical protein
MRARRVLPILVAGACVAAAAGPAAAFVRSTSARGHPDQGLCLWWGSRSIPYVVNASAIAGQGCTSAAAVSTELQSGFAAWSQAKRSGQGTACTDLAFPYVGPSTQTDVGFDAAAGASNENLVVMRRTQCTDTSVVPANDPCHATAGGCATQYNCWAHGAGALSASAIALTTVTYASDTGQIVDADVELNGWNGNSGAAQDGSAGWYYTCGGSGTCANPPYGLSSCNFVDVANTFTHELGHLIGLDHTCVAAYPSPFDACPSGSVMAPTATLGQTAKRTLSADDVEAICTIYPAGRATVTCVAPSPPASKGGGGCATGMGGGLAGVIVALMLLRRRR